MLSLPGLNKIIKAMKMSVNNSIKMMTTMHTFAEYVKETRIDEAGIPKLRLLNPKLSVVKTVETALKDKLKVISWIDKRAIDKSRGVQVKWQNTELPTKSEISAMAKNVSKALSNEYKGTSTSISSKSFTLEFASLDANSIPRKFGVKLDFGWPEWSYNAKWCCFYPESTSEEFAEKVSDIIDASCNKFKIDSYSLYHPKYSRYPWSYSTFAKEVPVVFKKSADADAMHNDIKARFLKAGFTEDPRSVIGGVKMCGKTENDYCHFYMKPSLAGNRGWLAIYAI